MLNELKQLKRKIELKNPENRGIIRAYIDAEFGRLDEAVYSPLEKRYPSLNGFLGAMRKECDPIETMEEANSQMQMVGNLKRLVGLTSLVDEDEDTQAVKTMLDKIDTITELHEKFSPIQEQFYVDLAHTVKRVSTQRGIGVESTVGDLQYNDEVFRIVISTREKAEAFLRTSQTYESGLFDITRGYFAFAKKTGRADEDVLEKAKLMPTAKAMEAIQKCTWDYKMREFDRVYSAE